MIWNNSILQVARRLKYQNGLSWDEVAEAIKTDFDLDEAISGNAIRKAVARRDETSLLLDSLPDPTPRQFPEVLMLPPDNALFIGDLHVDYYDREFLKTALRTAEQYQCKGIVIGGDLFNGAEFAVHPKDEPNPTPFKTEMEMVGKILSVLGNLPWCEWIGITNGNHDRRYTKKLNAYVSLESLVYGALAGQQIKAKLHITNFDYAYYRDWGVGHLSNWSKDGGKLALDQARRHNKRIFAVWHDHIQGIQSDHERVGISVGSMIIENSQYYKERHLTKFSNFVNGFLISVNGTPILYNKKGVHPMCREYTI